MYINDILMYIILSYVFSILFGLIYGWILSEAIKKPKLKVIFPVLYLVVMFSLLYLVWLSDDVKNGIRILTSCNIAMTFSNVISNWRKR